LGAKFRQNYGGIWAKAKSCIPKNIQSSTVMPTAQQVPTIFAKFECSFNNFNDKQAIT